MTVRAASLSARSRRVSNSRADEAAREERRWVIAQIESVAQIAHEARDKWRERVECCLTDSVRVEGATNHG